MNLGITEGLARLSLPAHWRRKESPGSMAFGRRYKRKPGPHREPLGLVVNFRLDVEDLEFAFLGWPINQVSRCCKPERAQLPPEHAWFAADSLWNVKLGRAVLGCVE